MRSSSSFSGIACVGEVEWGTHFCQFYETRDDLVDSLVPYFKSGIENNEQCLWVTANPFCASDARSALNNAVPDLQAREEAGQIEILDHEEWYTKRGVMDTPTVLKKWVETQERALACGFHGLRLSGNTHWLDQRDWCSFERYEALVSETFRPHRIIALCSYCLEKTHSKGVLDVVRNHQFAVVRRGGDWEMIESTALKVAKSELQQLNRELETRVSKRTAELETMLKVRDEFLSIASHELKTPLSSLKLQLDSTLRAQARRMISAEEVHKRLTKAETQCRRLDTLVSNLLDISRAGLGKLPIHSEKVDLSDIVTEVVERFCDQAAEKKCVLRAKTSEKGLGYWDRMRLDQVITNLLANAIKYAPGSIIEVEVLKDVESAQLRVKDDGPGIDECDQHKIFERFTQLPGAHSTSGFGLGLWIVKEIAHRLAGTVSVSSIPGQGATFTVTLPFGQGEMPAQV